ncbi:MAG TPA: ABC transporter ATP-binding protein [Gammaproteobacteria bacterium]|nr:ABC transporter ATP-binding protein [Gammaproteobacteria bacterium]
MADRALVVDGVSKAFGAGDHAIQALEGVSIHVERGRVTGLIGPDGAGKTTLMRLCCGLYAPDAGAIRVMGLDTVAQSARIQAVVGYMPQRFGLYEDLTVQENLDLYADLNGLGSAEREQRFGELMAMTGLAPFTGRLAGRLSGGMKQKLGLACTLLRRPPLMLLDEPTVGVDPVSRRELWRIIYREVETAGTTVLLSTAYLDEAARCDEVVMLHRGRVLGQGPPEAFSRPLAGRVYIARAQGLSRRALQGRLAASPRVLDAIIAGDAVRVVTREAGISDPARVAGDLAGLTLEPAEPRFEDAFVATLREIEPARGEEQPLMRGHGARQDGEEIIRVRHLVRRFGDFTAVKGISFSVRRGEIFGLLGANGAGKSTTFRILCGLLPATDGTVAVAGYDLRRAAAPARRRLGYMAQRFSLYPTLTVMQNLQFFASAYGLTGRRRGQRIRWALETFDLADYADLNSSDLSLGHRQRLAFAVALMHEPDILFLDEPTSGVDPLARREFWRRTSALAEAGVTVLVTTHFMEEANYCDRLVIMAEGEVLAEGSPEDLKSRVRSAALPSPTMEDAFIGLVGRRQEAGSA